MQNILWNHLLSCQFSLMSTSLTMDFGFKNIEFAQHSKHQKGTVQSWLLYAAGPPFQQSA